MFIDNCKTIDSVRLTTFYQDVYGPWTVERSVVREVIFYRSGLVTAAVSFVLASSSAFLTSDSSLTDLIKQNLKVLFALGACGLGLSLVLIHIYVTEIKQTLQALWLLGVFGSLATKLLLAQPADESLIQYIIDNPIAVWFVGPQFAALTGLVFKEEYLQVFQYPRQDDAISVCILTFVIPLVLLGHLSSLMDDRVNVTLLGVWMALFAMFAGRKFTQPIKDNIGHKSVFMFNALPEEEKAALVQKLEQKKYFSES